MADYFFDSVEGNDGNSGLSDAEAWKTAVKFNASAGLFSPGDFINVKRGSMLNAPTYEGLIIDDSGTKQNPITLRAYSEGELPILTNPGNNNWSRILTLNADWVAVDGLKLSDAHEQAVRVGGNDNVIRNCEMTKVGHAAQLHGKRNLIEENFIYDLRWIVDTGDPKTSNGGQGVVLYNGENRVIDNVFANSMGEAISFDGQFRPVNNCLIESNLVTKFEGLIEYGKGSFCNHVVAKNISVDCKIAAVFHLGGTFASAISNLEFKENSIIETGGGWALLAFIDGDPNEFMIDAHHNLFYAEDYTFVSNKPGFGEHHNYYRLIDTELGFELGKGSVILE